jgi:extracellular elastinolytic metalloproteinase
MGWFDQGQNRIFTDTRGNNVFAQDNPSGGAGWINNYRPSCGSALDCRFPIDLNTQPAIYKDAAILNLFWWNNIIHDIFYLRGFDEVSGNAQENNIGRGGRENDAVQANAQDGAGFNNANMATPIDGQRGRMRMYLWNGITPMRDGDLDSGIIVHEYAHHISIRLTGGPLNVGCLGSGQAGGMGEGWGDWFATMFLQTLSTTRAEQFPMGLYAARRGIRPFPYSTDRIGNPQTFGILNQGPPYNAVHAIGSVWCQILFQVYWEMRDTWGFTPDWWYGEGGNMALLQDVTDGFKIQPCTPNFVQARDAILQADRQNYAGRHVCTLWRGFAFRGLGTGAIVRSTNSVTESFDIPNECR